MCAPWEVLHVILLRPRLHYLCQIWTSSWLWAEVTETFSIKNLGIPKQFLGIEMKWNENESDTKKPTRLINKLSETTGTSKLKTVESRFDKSELMRTVNQQQLTADTNTMLKSIKRSYMCLATHARPDLDVVVSMLFSRVQSQRDAHMLMGKRALR